MAIIVQASLQDDQEVGRHRMPDHRSQWTDEVPVVPAVAMSTVRSPLAVLSVRHAPIATNRCTTSTPDPCQAALIGLL